MRLHATLVRTSMTLTLGVLACASSGCSDDAAGRPSSKDDAVKPDDGHSSESGCAGFEVVGLRYSPGGNVLPDTCKPFDASTNNPYAIRCVDAIPGYATDYPGDEFCILPPPPDKGLQVGLHPQGASFWDEVWSGDLSGYSDAARLKDFEVAPGGEVEQTYSTTMTNDAQRLYYRLDSRMRVGSHHMATYFTSSPGEEGWRPINPGEFSPAGADGGFFWNSQRTNSDRPASSLEIPEEDASLGMSISPHQGILFDVHHFNTRNNPILREAWINIWWVDGSVDGAVQDEPLVAPVDVPPNSLTDLDGSFAPEKTTRVLSLFGHRHAWTRRLNAWVHRANGDDEPVYDSFNWLDVPTYSYDSVATNPVADPGAERDGASSGLLTLDPGEAQSRPKKAGSTGPKPSRIRFETAFFG